MYRVDYKCDEMAGTTGNLALEHVSVVRKGRREVSGWVHTSFADLVVSYVPALDRALVLEVDALRLAWPDIMSLFPPRFATTGGLEPYQSLVCCVPIPWLESAGLIARSVDAVGAQLRLPLKVGQRPLRGGDVSSRRTGSMSDAGGEALAMLVRQLTEIVYVANCRTLALAQLLIQRGVISADELKYLDGFDGPGGGARG